MLIYLPNKGYDMKIVQTRNYSFEILALLDVYSAFLLDEMNDEKCAFPKAFFRAISDSNFDFIFSLFSTRNF